MKNLIKPLVIIILFRGLSLAGQCQAIGHVGYDGCHIYLTNKSNASLVSKWRVNGVEYPGTKGLSYSPWDSDSFDVCLYVEDTMNNCSDSICSKFPGKKKEILYDYYVYKQNLYVTLLTRGSKYASYTIFWGDGKITTSSIGFYRHVYSKPGKYEVLFQFWDSIPSPYNGYCPYIVKDSIEINNNSHCRSFFVFWHGSGQDSIWLVNRAVGENLAYKWTFGDGSSSAQRFPVHTYTTTGTKEICLTIRDTIGNCTDSYCSSLDVKPGLRLQIIGDVFKDTTPPTSGVIYPDLFHQVVMYPNPTSDILTIGNLPRAEVQWQLKTADGHIVKQGIFEVSHWNSNIDLFDISAGVYFLTLQSKEQRQTSKVIKID